MTTQEHVEGALFSLFLTLCVVLIFGLLFGVSWAVGRVADRFGLTGVVWAMVVLLCLFMTTVGWFIGRPS